MTVIAYKDGIMASDSMLSSKETGDKLNFGPKVFKIGKALVGISGSAQILVKIKEIKISKKVPHIYILNKISSILEDDEEDHDFDIMVVINEKKFIFDNSSVPCEIYDDFFAIGAGAPIAMGAMECGATAVEAVNAAIVHNIFCGGSIHTVEND